MASAQKIVPPPHTLSVGPYRLAIWAQPGARTVVYVHPGTNDLPAACELIFARAAESAEPLPPFAIVGIDGVDWNRDLSPWFAAKVFQSGYAFSGGADAYLKTLQTAILPAVEATLDALVTKRALAGYSMGGLFALYAMYRTDRFDRFASMSGSLWFDGFADFMQTHAPLRKPENVYLSLGNSEKRTQNPRLAAVETCTLLTAARLSDQGVPVLYEPQPGGHAADVPKRLADGILHML